MSLMITVETGDSDKSDITDDNRGDSDNQHSHNQIGNTEDWLFKADREDRKVIPRDTCRMM